MTPHHESERSATQNETTNITTNNDYVQDLREHEENQQLQRQQQQNKQQQQQNHHDFTNPIAPHPDERSATRDATTDIAADDDLTVQNCPQEEQEHAPATQTITTSSSSLSRSSIALFERSAGS